MSEIERPALYVVATPIGNRGDLSPRAAAILSGVDVIAAEDTRVSGPMLRDMGCTTRLVSLHEHNERERTPELLNRLEEGQSVALISDAGTPLISDPGFSLVRAVQAAGFTVRGIPGACAAIVALSISGLPTDQFFFAGFVAAKTAARQRQFDELRALSSTLIFYASKRQLGPALGDASDVFGADRPAVIARELTKLHETVHAATLGELTEKWPTLEHRGEWVLMIGGDPGKKADDAEIERVLGVLLARVSLRDAAAMTAQLLNVPKRQAYSIGLTLESD